MAIRKPSKPADGDNVNLSRMAPETDLERMIPTVWEWLTTTAFEDGDSRIPSTLLILSEGGRVKVCLNDRASSRSTWKSGQTLDAALLSLDEALAADNCEWRESQGPPGKFRKK